MSAPTPPPKGWLNRQEAADAIGKTLSSITRATDAGLLNPHRDETGKLWFDPREVEELKANPMMPVKGIGAKPDDPARAARREHFAEWELSTVKDLVASITVPRQKADDYLFRVMDFQDGLIKRLFAEKEEGRKEVEESRDGNAERAIIAEQHKSETRIKEFAIQRFIQAGLRFLEKQTGSTGNGLVLTSEQIEQLIVAGEFFSPEQEAIARKEVADYQRRQALIAAGKEAAAAKPPEAKQEPKPEPKPESKPAIETQGEESKS